MLRCSPINVVTLRKKNKSVCCRFKACPTFQRRAKENDTSKRGENHDLFFFFSFKKLFIKAEQFKQNQRYVSERVKCVSVLLTKLSDDYTSSKKNESRIGISKDLTEARFKFTRMNIV